MADLNGTWIYQSFRPDSGPPSPVVPWSPLGRLSCTTDGAGSVVGELRFRLPPPVSELVLTVSGSIVPAQPAPFALPEGIELSAKSSQGAVYSIRGFFVPGGAGPVVAGTVYSIQNDAAGQPNGASGPFVLFRAG